MKCKTGLAFLIVALLEFRITLQDVADDVSNETGDKEPSNINFTEQYDKCRYDDTEDIDRCSHLSVNVAWTGGRMLTVSKWIKTVLDCKWECMENTECRAWTYVTKDYNETESSTSERYYCTLWASQDGAQFAPHHVSGRVKCEEWESSQDEACYQYDVDFQGHDLDVDFHVSGTKECRKICEGRKGCKTWTYVTESHSYSNEFPAQSRACLLKTSAEGARHAPNHISGIINCSDGNRQHQRVCMNMDLEYAGDNVGTATARNVFDCRTLCQEEDSCNFWTYDKTSKVCSFKSCNGGTMQALGKVSGAKTCREAEDEQDLPVAIFNATMNELSMCEAEAKDCNIEVTENNEIFIPGCGATNYPSRTEWKRVITVEEGKIIQFNLVESDFDDDESESPTSCWGDELSLYDGNTRSYTYEPKFRSNILKKFCSKLSDITVYSTGNQMMLEFEGGYRDSTGSGIRANYRVLDPSEKPTPTPVECGSDILASNGTIDSPNFPNIYPNNAHCTWNIELPNKDGKIRWRLKHENLEYDIDWVIARDPLNNFTVLRENYPPIGNKLQVVFTSDESIAGKGFQLDFEDISECGGEITLDSDGGEKRIKSPNYYYRTPPLMTCTWTINVPEGNNLAVTLDGFYFGNCDDDIEVRDRVEFTGPGGETLKSLCGYPGQRTFALNHAGPITMTMITGPLSVKSYADNTFNIVFNAFEPVETIACNTQLTATSEKAVLASPGYPLDYKNVTSDCYWDITADQPDGRVAIIFEEFKTSGCYDDYVDVLEGEKGKKIAKVCNYDNNNKVLKSEGPNIRVRFPISSYSRRGNGFRAKYWTLGPMTPNCGSNITGDSGSIKFDSIDVEDDPSEEYIWCQWIITASEGSVVELDIERLQNEYYFSCSKTRINIYDGSIADNSTLLNGGREYCLSSRPPPYSDRFFTSTSNQMLVELKLEKDRYRDSYYDSWDERSTKFEASWPSDFGKMHTLTDPSGTIQSPNYPGKYGGLARDTYLIRVSPDSRIKVVIEDMDLEQCSECNCDHVSIFNGGTVNNPIGKFCSNFDGSLNGAWFLSDSNEVRIEYGTDRRRGGKGFKITYETVTPNKIEDECLLSNTTIISTDFLNYNSLSGGDGNYMDWYRMPSVAACKEKCVEIKQSNNCDSFSATKIEERDDDEYDYYGYRYYGPPPPSEDYRYYCSLFPKGRGKLLVALNNTVSGRISGCE